MDSIPNIVPMEERNYQMIPVDKIKVINSRDRDSEQFEMNVLSIDHVGLRKPIHVNDKYLKRSGFYELICGEGRLMAHRQLGRETVKAQVLTCTRKEALLKSLIENIARTNPESMDHARELKRMHDEGWSYEEISEVACQTPSYIREYIRLVEQGEDRLIHGVEQGVFPIKFAIRVAASKSAELQNLLMDAFDDGIVTTSNFAQARKIITARARQNKRRKGEQEYTVDQLKRDIVDVTKAKSSYVREAKTKENRFMTLLSEINLLWQDEEFLRVVRKEGLYDRPELSGDFSYDS